MYTINETYNNIKFLTSSKSIITGILEACLKFASNDISWKLSEINYNFNNVVQKCQLLETSGIRIKYRAKCIMFESDLIKIWVGIDDQKIGYDQK